MSTLTIHNREVSLASEVRAASGGLITFKKYAEMKGIDLKDKAAKKLANQTYSAAKREAYQQYRKVALLAVADREFNTVKVKPRIDEETGLKGFDIAVRLPSKAEQKAATAPAVSKLAAENAAIKAELEALKAQFAAVVEQAAAEGK